MKTKIKRNWKNLLIILLILVVLGLLHSLSKSSKLYNHLMLSSYNYFELGDNYVSIDGTWASQSEEELGNSFQTVKFTCDKEEGTCQQVVADTVFGILSLFTEVSRVTSWDKNFITAETSGVCVIYKYRIDRLQKELVGIRQTINHEGVCAVVSQDDLKIKLVDGVKKVLKLRGY